MKRHADTNPASAGFTLIELLVVLAIVAILFGLVGINLGRPQTVANGVTSVDTLLADLRSQQLLAMAGDTSGTSSALAHGIFFEPTQYTLFAGDSYDAGDTNNFVVHLAAGAEQATTLPSGQVVFAKGTGEAIGLAGGSDTITITSGDTSRTITINRLGTPVVSEP